MMTVRLKTVTCTAGLLAGALLCQQALGAIALDRTRVIYPGGEKSLSLSIRNENKQLPYLAQAWLEDADGKKISTPLAVVPPLQRVEPGAASQIEVRATPAAAQLPQDRESLFYFNLREIPPKSDKPNTLQLALQTRVKLFYRPKAIQQTKAEMATPWQEKLTLSQRGGQWVVTNPTPYYVTLAQASNSVHGGTAAGFKPVMVSPEGNVTLPVSAAALGSSPVLGYVDDYGGTKTLTFRCGGSQCQVIPGHKAGQ